MTTYAIFSSCKNYRYLLARLWNPLLPTVLFVGLNPSTADSHTNDPTVKRCIDFARQWNYGGLYLTNLFAYRNPHPQQLLQVKDPIGKDNDHFILHYQQFSQRTIIMWGNYGTLLNRHEQVLQLLTDPYCLKINKSGAPAHPLYLRKTTEPFPYGKDHCE